MTNENCFVDTAFSIALDLDPDYESAGPAELAILLAVEEPMLSSHNCYCVAREALQLLRSGVR
jgi:hypothetical protein